MAAIPEPWRLLTIAEYRALREDDDKSRRELQEGILNVMAPRPLRHNVVGADLFAQVDKQLPQDLVAMPSVDLDIQLVPVDEPATVRRPDLVVVDRAAFDRVGTEGEILRASDARLVIEIACAGSRRTDYVMKRSEYEDAEIPHYWIIDISPPISLVAFRLTDELGYVDNGEVTDVFTTTSPCPLTIRLDRLG